MKRVFIFAVMSVINSACLKETKNKVRYPVGHDIPNTPERIVIRSSDSSAESQRRTGPAPLLLGPDALHEVYKDVFSDSLSEAKTSFFENSEKDDLGGYRILNPSNPRGGFEAADPVMKRNAKLSSDYVFALRKFSASACKVLIEKEMQTPDKPSNLIVEGGNPSIGKIDRFMTMLLGHKSKTGIHSGVQNYKDAFEKMISSAPPPKSDIERTDRISVSYNHLCVALATDVRVYVR